MRVLRFAPAIALMLVVGSAVGGAAAADESTPSRQEVREARSAVQLKSDDVASVRARLVLANQRLESSAVAAARAAEAWNGARWAVHQTRVEARAAQHRSEIAGVDVARQQQAYSDALVTSYVAAPGLTALSAMASSDGITSVIERATTLHNAEDALDGRYEQFQVSATLADVATDQAVAANAAATEAQAAARAARDQARNAARAARTEARAIAAEKTVLIAQLADLEQISVELAQSRQSDLEARALASAAASAEREREQAAAAAGSAAGGNNDGASGQSTSTPAPSPSSNPAPSPAPSTPSPSPPPPAAGAQGAIDFARAQLGEPYRWGAAGPDAWDCSGLTAGAWRAGGRSLPHYSVAQYQASSPVSLSNLRPGDLVFWGSSDNSSSIYHVALYIGGGQIIHAPRAGRPVVQESLYYWVTPNFAARP